MNLLLHANPSEFGDYTTLIESPDIVPVECQIC